jgi:hypothetical protein
VDILVLIDKLDDLVHNARGVPMTSQVRVDREEVYALLDELRASIPGELKRAESQAPLEALRMRYAQGELTREEFLAAEADLTRTQPG